jgi:hypothetical protein
MQEEKAEAFKTGAELRPEELNSAPSLNDVVMLLNKGFDAIGDVLKTSATR